MRKNCKAIRLTANERNEILFPRQITSLFLLATPENELAIKPRYFFIYLIKSLLYIRV